MSNIFKSDNQVTTRSSSFSLMAVDSSDRSPNQPLNNFTVNQGTIMASGYPTRIGLVTLFFPWAIPNVNKINNTLSITDGTTIYTATIPEDFYEINELSTAIQTGLNSLGYGGVFSVTVNSKTGYYTVVNSTTPFAFIRTPQKNKDLLLMSGLQTNITQALTQNGTYNSLLYTNFFDIRSNQLTRFQQILDSSTDDLSDHIITRVLVDFGNARGRDTVADTNLIQWWTRPGSIAFETVNVKWMRYLPQGEFISNTDFFLTDDHGNPLYMPVGSPDYQMIFHLSET